MLIGHARVSTEEQNLASQLDALRLAGCEFVFCDVGVSGGTTDRQELARALLSLSPDDVLVVWKLDRLGRSLSHLIHVIAQLADLGVGFRSLSEAIDTTTASGRLLFHIMGAIAEFERSLISERTRAGMEAARARGQHLGRARKLSDEDAQWANNAIKLGYLGPEEIASVLSVSVATLRRAIKRVEVSNLELR